MGDGSKTSKCCNKHYNNGLIVSTSYILSGRSNYGKGTKRQANLFRSHPLGKNIRAREVGLMDVQVCPMSPFVKKTVASIEHQASDSKFANPIRVHIETYCQVKVESINKLKDSTRKLLHLIDDIQSKSYSKDLPLPHTDEIELVSSTAESADGTTFSSISDEAEPALKYLEAQTKALNNIYIEDYDDDCSIFKRLTRKCNCLNQLEYNDFMIHFNEESKYFTNTLGEIIKNIRILKKFLYMGGTYTKNALLFLNEGLEKSAYAEKAEITQGCSHSDVCNVFESHSIVLMCISGPCKHTNFGDNYTQFWAASFLYKLVQLEEGRRYLKYTSKISNEIKQVLRKRGSQLDAETVDCLKAALNLINPPMAQNVNSTYCRQSEEGNVNEIINALQQFRKYMTLDEVFEQLNLLTNFSNVGKGKTDLIFHLPSLLNLFKEMLREYDNSDMNIIITDILNNIVSKNTLQQKETDRPKQMMMADTATEPIEKRNQIIQMPQKLHFTKKAYNQSKQYLGYTKFGQASKRVVSEFANPTYLNRSRKFSGKNIILVPME